MEFLKIGTAGYGLAENIILIEFLAIAMVIIFCYVLKLFYFLKRKRKKQYTALIESHLLELVSTKKPFSKSNFPPSWMKMDVLVIIINKLDRNISSPEWGKIRMSLLHSVVLPLARRAANSYYWILRFYAAESFSLAGEAQDEKLILSLVNDKVPLVYLNALTAALNYGAERAIDVIIKKMAQERALTQGAYLQAFSTVSSTTRPLIEKYLQKSIEPFERATCYKILNQYPADKITWDLTEDIQSNNLELKIATIRFIAYNHLKNVIPILIKLLQDPEWKVRVAAIHGLGDLQATDALSEIAVCLRDPEWWVRINSAQVLMNFGEPGIQILKAQDPKVDKFAFETAQHVLGVS